MATNDAYPWARRETESSPAYEAFRVYMDTRSIRKAADQLGKNHTILAQWSAKHDWIERVSAFDSYLMDAKTDGQVDWITNARTETQQLADKLRGLLNERLDDCIRLKQDPTMRWSTAVGMLIKLQDAGVTPVDNAKMEAELDRVAKLLEKVTGERITQ